MSAGELADGAGGVAVPEGEPPDPPQDESVMKKTAASHRGIAAIPLSSFKREGI
jgi:hypothetical protein